MHPDPIVYLVEDDLALRESIRLLMKSVGLSVAGFSRAQEFLDAIDAGRPGCALIDVRLPGMSGLDLVELMAQKHLHLPVIVITGHGDVPMAVRAMRAGAIDFLEKPYNEQFLLDRVNQALEESGRRLTRHAERTAILGRLALLTPREQQVLELQVAGKTNQEIIDLLQISRKTLDIHRTQVKDKMEAPTLAALANMMQLVQGTPGGLPLPVRRRRRSRKQQGQA